MLKNKETPVLFILFAMGAALYVMSAIKVQELRDHLDPTQTVSALQISPEVLEIVSGEYRSLMADFLLLKASVYLGGRHSDSDSSKAAVATLFRQSAALDPYFFQTCFLVQGYLPWWKGDMPKKAIEILELERQHRDWDWQPGFFIGFDYFYFLKDNVTASRYLMEISERHDAAQSLGFLGARLAQKGGETIASIGFLKTMHAGTENENAKEEIERRILALEGILKLEKAIDQFQAKFFGHPPDTLEQLVEAGILKTLPLNPSRRDGLYLYENGNIDF